MRVLLRVISPLLGLAVAALGVLLALETVWAWVHPGAAPLVVPWRAWRSTADSVTWADLPVQLVAAGVGVVGVLLVLLAAGARRREVRLTDPAPDVTVITSPRSLARLVGHQVRALDEVQSASVTATPTKIAVRVTSPQPPDQSAPRVRERIGELLTGLPLARRPRVRVHLTQSEGPA